MQIEIQHPAFLTQQLAVETAGVFSGPKLLLNGVPVESAKGNYVLADDAGKEVAIKLKYNYFDPIPKIEIDGVVETLADPLAWYEWLWIGLPLVMLTVGGAIGGFLGAIAATANGRVFRGDNSTAQKWIYSLVITVLAFGLFAAAAKQFRSMRAPSIESRLEEAAAEVNRAAKTMVDKDTRLDSAFAGPGKVLTFHYTMVNMAPGTAPATAVLQSILAPGVRKNVCASGIRDLLEHDVVLHYVYHESDGKRFGDISITRHDCR